MSRDSDSRNTSCVKSSARIARPPVIPTATFISASPTWSSEHAKTSRQYPWSTMRCPRPA